jgi:hypothetical protein
VIIILPMLVSFSRRTFAPIADAIKASVVAVALSSRHLGLSLEAVFAKTRRAGAGNLWELLSERGAVGQITYAAWPIAWRW